MKTQANSMDWPGLKIRRAIEDAGFNQADLAVKIGKSRPSVNMVIWHSMTSHGIRTAIAEVIGVDVSVIWPSHYLKDQKRAA